MQVEEFHYRLPWRARGAHPGHHRGTRAGGGVEFRGHAPLLAAPDPRRVDLRASLRDPFGQLLVRRYTQRSASPVYAVADLSASMGFRGRSRKLDVLAEFTASLGYSAYRTGDPFAFIGCDTAIHPDFVLPLSRAKAAGPALGARLREFTPTGQHARGLLQAPTLLARQRGLVFLLSDFHFPLALLEAVLAAMAHHAVVPVVLWDSVEIEPAAFGIASVCDPETGRRRTLLLREATRASIRRAFARRRHQLVDCFLRNGLEPLFMADRFTATGVTRYFYE